MTSVPLFLLLFLASVIILLVILGQSGGKTMFQKASYVLSLFGIGGLFFVGISLIISFLARRRAAMVGLPSESTLVFAGTALLILVVLCFRISKQEFSLRAIDTGKDIKLIIMAGIILLILVFGAFLNLV